LVALVLGFSTDNPGSTIHDLMQYLDLAAQADAEECDTPRESPADAIRLSTAHSAKGLEFDHVYVFNAVEGEFPGRIGGERRLDLPAELVEEELSASEPVDEERRLFYVALTRARQTLCITYARR